MSSYAEAQAAINHAQELHDLTAQAISDLEACPWYRPFMKLRLSRELIRKRNELRSAMHVMRTAKSAYIRSLRVSAP